MSNFEKGTKVRPRKGAKRGVTTGSRHRCRMHGCTGIRLTVRWSDGKLTFPCSKGMSVDPNGDLRIE